MNHLIISREYPPAPYVGGGIGTYVDHMSKLLAEAGETVHVIAQLCPAAPRERESRLGGRLVVHRVPIDRPLGLAHAEMPSDRSRLDAFRHSAVPSQAFAWQAARLAESLIVTAGIDAVEAQEYEAPLYFLMTRRASGLGPARKVPLVVHLHSPSEFVLGENECRDRPEFQPLTQLEAFTIRAADALMSPSHFLAGLAESHYDLARGSVSVIPYPLGSKGAALARSDAIWREGAILYVGRLEPRKGVREWVDAAAAVGAADASSAFSFVGGDTPFHGTGGPSMRGLLRESIPASMQSRFTFFDAVPQYKLAVYRVQARIAVVPSRWENFPYTCIEAMASGLPVLASPSGGMAEMIEDGRTGWVAERSDARSLAAGLRRALSVPPAALAHMGAAAAEAIRALCDDGAIVRQHLAFTGTVVDRGCRPEPLTVRPPAGVPDLDELRPAEPVMRGTQTDTMSPMDILRAPRAQQAAVIRRALANPAYVARWVAWHARRLASRWGSRVQRD